MKSCQINSTMMDGHVSPVAGRWAHSTGGWRESIGHLLGSRPSQGQQCL